MNTLTTITLISMASIGFRCISGKGMILYFLRKPFDDLINSDPSWVGMIIIYLFKPIHLCSTCMSSVHTLIWWPILQGEYNAMTILVMLSVAFLNTLLYSIIEKLS